MSISLSDLLMMGRFYQRFSVGHCHGDHVVSVRPVSPDDSDDWHDDLLGKLLSGPAQSTWRWILPPIFASILTVISFYLISSV